MSHQSTLHLSEAEQEKLHALLHKGKHSARTLYRARTLLLFHEGKEHDEIASSLSISESTVSRIKSHYTEGGIDNAIFDKPRSGRPKVLDEATGAYIVAIACSEAPEGHDHWTIDLIQERLEKDKKKRIARMSVWRYMDEHDMKPWLEKNVVCSRSYA